MTTPDLQAQAEQDFETLTRMFQEDPAARVSRVVMLTAYRLQQLAMGILSDRMEQSGVQDKIPALRSILRGAGADEQIGEFTVQNIESAVHEVVVPYFEFLVLNQLRTAGVPDEENNGEDPGANPDAGDTGTTRAAAAAGGSDEETHADPGPSDTAEYCDAGIPEPSASAGAGSPATGVPAPDFTELDNA